MNISIASRSTALPGYAWTLFGALIATTLDLAFAAIYWEVQGYSGLRVMQAIAAYWGWGREAYSGGLATALIGMGLFLGRMVLLAMLYRWAARRWAALIERPYLFGALFGVAVYVANSYLVVPLIDAMPARNQFVNWAWTCACIAAHMILIGIPLALTAKIAIAAADEQRDR